MFVAFVRRFACSAALALSCSGQGMATALTPGAVAGVVVDAEGRAVAGARVLLDGPFHLVSLTGWDGRFSIAGIAPGLYRATVATPRSTRPAVLDISVRAGETSALSVALPAAPARPLTAADSLTGVAGVSFDPADLADQGFTRVTDALQDDDASGIVSTGASGDAKQAANTAGAALGSGMATGHASSNQGPVDPALSGFDTSGASTLDLVRGTTPASPGWPDSVLAPLGASALEPTAAQHGLLRLDLGTFSAIGATLQTTGTLDGRFGYAFSLHRQDSAGEVNEPIYNLQTRTVEAVGSGTSGSSALANLRYSFGSAGAGYAEFSFLDQGSQRDLSASLSAYPALSEQASVLPPVTTLPQILGYAGASLQAHVAAYGLNASLPLGGNGSAAGAATTLLLHYRGASYAQSVTGPGAELSPYLFNDRDGVSDASLELDQRLGPGSLALQYQLRDEALTTDFVAPQGAATPGPVPLPVPKMPGRPATALAAPAAPLLLGETARTLSLRYSYLPAPALRLTASAEYAALSPFGAQFDPRVSALWSADAQTTARLTVGTAYQTPPLQELVVPKPLPDVSGGYVSVGNPNLKPVHATEYDLGFDRSLGASAGTQISADLYRSNLRTPVYTLLPPLEPQCGLTSVAGKGGPCPLSYPVNAGDGVDRGLELAVQQRLSAYASARATYAVHSSYLSSIPPEIQDGSLVEGQQSLGLPLHRATLTISGLPPRGFVYAAGLVYEGAYNALNQPSYATLAARAGYRFHGGYEVGIAGTNLTNVYDQRFTKTGLGVPYGGIGAPVGTDAYPLQGTAFMLTLTRRF